MRGMRWRKGAVEETWELVTSDGTVVTATGRPAIGYAQTADEESGATDVVLCATGSAEDMEAWKAGTEATLRSAGAMRAIVGAPRVLSGNAWDENELNAACESSGGLWRLLRKERLL